MPKKVVLMSKEPDTIFAKYPGPWHFFLNEIKDVNYNTIVKFYDKDTLHQSFGTGRVDKMVMTMMVASYDMYMALSELVSLNQYVGKEGKAAFKKAKKALAKARGESVE